MQLAKHLGAERLKAFSDSKLMVNHVSGVKAKEGNMTTYLGKAQEEISNF